MHIIYVDDELPALNNFRLTVAPFLDIESLHMFQTGGEALAWAETNPVDTAFLDMEMPGIHGLELARRLKRQNQNIRIVFVTAYSQYALDAFGVDAVGYVMKPYLRSDLRKELDKAARIRDVATSRILIETMPNLSVTIDGKQINLGNEKTFELFALLVDRGEQGIVMDEGIAALWPERSCDRNTEALFRVICKELQDALEEAGAGDIIESQNSRKYIRTDRVECDLYRLLSGDTKAAKKYEGHYLKEYTWAENRNRQLGRMMNWRC